MQIINHGDRTLDCDLGLDVVIDGKGFFLSLENSEIVNLPNSLPTGQRGNRQLIEPLQIGPNSRAVGRAVVNSEILPAGVLDNRDLDVFDEITLEITDGLENVMVSRYEVWPSIWRDVFERARHSADA